MNGLNMGRQRLLRIEAEQKVMKMCLSIGQMVAEAQGGTLEDEGATGLESTSIIITVDRPNNNSRELRAAVSNSSYSTASLQQRGQHRRAGCSDSVQIFCGGPPLAIPCQSVTCFYLASITFD